MPRDAHCAGWGKARPARTRGRADRTRARTLPRFRQRFGEITGTLDGFVLFKPQRRLPRSSSEDHEYRAFLARVSRADKHLPDVGVCFVLIFQDPALQTL
ncbi:unnamed protein product [Pipistrellus nathusii]|uniref:Uncharacterized protein n=1 Tax=Pipistrellus nathusii TaxID=59473 RepID=A0ABN9ZEM5_PIPNA